MTLEAIPIERITREELRSLIEDAVPEGRGIEYKRTLPGGTDADKREFLADVCSLANSGGGDLVFGVEETDGVASSLLGLSGDLDAEVLRIEGIIRDGIAPRIQGIVSQPVPLEGDHHSGNRQALVMRVPRSIGRPHVVTFKNHWKFFTRSSNGKHQMDVDEVRAAFVGSEAIAERVRAFRLERLGLLASGQAPVPLSKDATPALAVLHILPLSAFDSPAPAAVDLHLARNINLLPPGTGGTPRYNFDGIVTEGRERAGVEAYAQLFRSGGIEGATSLPFSEYESDGRPLIAMTALERSFIEALERYLELQRCLEVRPPTLVMLSLLGVRDYEIPAGSRRQHRPVDRDDLLVPETLIREEPKLDQTRGPTGAAGVLRGSFDAVWNACGYGSSLNYDDDGLWIGRC